MVLHIVDSSSPKSDNLDIKRESSKVHDLKHVLSIEIRPTVLNSRFA